MLITLAQTQSHDSISNSSNETRRGKAKRFLEFHHFSVSLLFASELSWATCAREEHFTEFLPGLGTCVLCAKIRGDQYSGRRYEPGTGESS